MSNLLNIKIPSKPEILRESKTEGTFEVSGLYPGYGHTLGNSIRRILLSSIVGTAITSVRIKGVAHEFSTIDGVLEDVLLIILNIKKINTRFRTDANEYTISLKKKGPGIITAKDFVAPSQVEIINTDLYIAEITGKNTEIELEATINKGTGYQGRDELKKNSGVGIINLDASFSPIKNASYEVSNMRVGDRTDFNKLKLCIETNGNISPSEALSNSIKLMILQLEAMVDFKNEEDLSHMEQITNDKLLNKTIEATNLSASAKNSLIAAKITKLKTLVKLTEKDLKELKGVGEKAVQEISNELAINGLKLKN